MKTETMMHNEPEPINSIQHWNECLETVAATRDKQAYLAFYDYFAPRLNSWLLGLTKNPTLSEELAQETMLSVWRKASQFDSSKAAASTWVFRIARNLYLDHLRRLKVRDKALLTLEDPEQEATDNGVDNERLRNAIKQLPIQQAQVIYKSYFEGKSHQEISDDMQLPLGSVKSSLRLAFQKLCKVMRPEHEH